jgi:preprotein translocase subunit SecF
MSTAITPRRRHTLKDIYHENTQFDFVHRVWRWGLLSGVLVVFAIGGLLLRGLDLSLEFTGGTSWQVTMANGKAPSIGDIRTLVENAGLTNPDVTIVGGNQIRVQAKVANSDSKNDAAKAKADAIKLKIQQVLAGYAGSTVEQVSFSDVGGSWGSDVSQKAIQALIAFFIIIALYLSLRFEFKMAVAALIAVVHDILIVAGAYAWTQFQVSPGTVIAFLTILGFSLYDTVVVFDKIRENAATLGSNRTDSYSRMVNTSVNSVLMRSLNTSFLALLPVISLLIVGVGFLGATTLEDFALALFAGLLVGAYSSIFVAVPILTVWKESEPRYRSMSERSTIALGRAAAGPSAKTKAGASRPAPGGAGRTLSLDDANDAPLGGDDVDADGPTAGSPQGSGTDSGSPDAATTPVTPTARRPAPAIQPRPRKRDNRGRK